MYDFDDAAARALLRPLDGEPDQPSTVEIAGLLRAGRRRVRRRRLLAGGGLATVTAVVLLAVPVGLAVVPDGRSIEPAPEHGAQPGPALGDPPPAGGLGTADRNPPRPPTTCTPQRLPLPAGATSSQLFDGDPTGRYLVGVARDERTARTWTLRWDRGVMTVLEPETTDPAQLLVNSAGVVAGDGVAVRDGRAVLVSWIYRDGRYVELTDSNGGYVGDVMDLNERGDVLGGIRTLAYRGKPVGTKGGPPESPDAGEVPGHSPAVWAAGAEQDPTWLPQPVTGRHYATGLDDDGTVVGGVVEFGEAGTTRTTVWAPDGTARALVPPPRHAATTGTLSVRNGWMLGWSVALSGGAQQFVPTRWNLRTGQVAPVTGLAWTAAINRYGWVAGFVRDASGVETPAVLAGQRPLALPMPPGAVPGKEGPAAVSISDDGRVVGGTVSIAPDDAATAAVRWTCE